MSDSEDSPDECANDAQTDKNGEEKEEKYLDPKSIPKYMRRRYWHSWEEMRLMELWRQRFSDIVSLDKNMPVFRDIAVAMKDSGFHINGQEVRRKLNSIKNKYLEEKRILKESAETQSQWRLYPLVDSIFAPPNSNVYKYNEEQALASICKKTSENPLYGILLSGLPVLETLERIEAGEIVEIPPPKKFENSFPIENRSLSESIAFGYANANRLSFTPRTQRPSEIAISQARMQAAAAENHAKIDTKVNFLKRKATMAAIQQIRSENRCLAEQCVIASKRLKQEEQQFKIFETLVEQIQTQYKNLMKKLVSAET